MTEKITFQNKKQTHTSSMMHVCPTGVAHKVPIYAKIVYRKNLVIENWKLYIF